MAKTTISEHICKGCGLCVTACPKKIIVIAEDKINAKGYYPAVVVNQADCIGCAMCAMMCPDVAIEVEKE